MTITPPECAGEWVTSCGCPQNHNYCWPEPNRACCAALQTDDTTPPERVALVQSALRIAVQILHGLSGRQFGVCEVTVRPCRDDCVRRVPAGVVWVTPDLVDGTWTNVLCGSCTSGCRCTAVSELKLPGRVEYVSEVRIDGAVVPAGEYRVDNAKLLVAQGSRVWPLCQDLSAPAGSADTWSVTYGRGTPVPEAGSWASGLLACEIVKACSSGEDGSCQLPANLKAISREGVTMDLEQIDLSALGNNGRTGIPEVDLWLSVVNPYKVTGRARAYSPDVPRQRETTWPCP